MIRVKPLEFKSIYEIVDEFDIKNNNVVFYDIKTKPFYKSTTDFLIFITDIKNDVILKVYDNQNKVIETFNIKYNDGDSYLKLKWFYFINKIEIRGNCKVKIYSILKNI